MSETSTFSEWPDKVRALLDTYLCEFGISSEATRAHWINRVVDNLASQAEPVASEDILEEAVEQMRDLIEVRVAMIANRDPAREHKEIAQMMVVLLNEKYADCLNMLFEHSEADGDVAMLEQVRRTLTSSVPIPVPQQAPLAVPVQAIELRSINPLRRLFGRSS